MEGSRLQKANVTDRLDEGDVALVICGHGSHLNPDSSAPVYDHAARIRAENAFSEVREAFWKEEPSLRNALRTIEAENVVVVPLFVSEGYFTDGVIPRELRLTEGSAGLDVAKRVWYTGPVGTHPSMTDVIVKRAERVTENPAVGPGTGLAVIGHGTERNPTSARATRDHAARIADRDRFEEVRALFMDQEPFVDDVFDHFSTRTIVAVPLFVADGFHTREEIPELLGLAGEYPAYENPSEVNGHEIRYAGAVGTEPAFADVIAERAHEALSRAPDADDRSPARENDSGSNTANSESKATAARRAFRERVERDIERDGLSAWGEVVITADTSLSGSDSSDGDAGTPRTDGTYEVRHGAERDADPGALDASTDPYDAREIARFDDDGAYRPLKSAPTLARGWRLTDLSSRDLYRAISYLYPASVENWHRERVGDLDVTHYAQTAARQTGMYASVDELGGEALDRAVGACCADEVCLKRRVWEAGKSTGDANEGGRAICAPNGDGPIPCREPCSLFVAAAREFVLVERNSAADRENGNHAGSAASDSPLTETDRERIEGIRSELAEDSAESVRDGEVGEPTNRYRVRYLREKLRALDDAERVDSLVSAGGED